MPRLCLPIACAINSGYIVPLLVMLTSLKEHLRPSYEPLLYLVHQGVNDDLLNSISRLVDTRSIVLGPLELAALPGDPHFPPEAASPLLLPDLLPEAVDRILFLDADLLVLGDVAELWETPMQDRVLAAVPDSAIPRCGSSRGVKDLRLRGIPENAAYFNAGVMLIDLSAWRKGQVTSHALAYLRRENHYVDFLHQEALNAVLWNQWLPLDARWNLLGSVAGRACAQRDTDSWRNPGIVHFAGRVKPWRSPVGGPFGRRYSEYLSRATEEFLAPPLFLPVPSMKEKLMSLYDRHLRDSLYRWEQALWTRRFI